MSGREVTPVQNREAVYQNEETGFGVYLEDAADLLTDSEEEQLAQAMIPIRED